jgi:hypothetical protein
MEAFFKLKLTDELTGEDLAAAEMNGREVGRLSVQLIQANATCPW